MSRVVRPWPWPRGQIFWPWPWGFWPWPCVSGLGLGLVESQGQGQSDQYSSKHSVSRYNYTYSTLVYQRHWYRHSASPSTVWYYSVISLCMPWSLELVLALRLLALALALSLEAFGLGLETPGLVNILAHESFHVHGPERVWATRCLMSPDRGPGISYQLHSSQLTVSTNSRNIWKPFFLFVKDYRRRLYTVTLAFRRRIQILLLTYWLTYLLTYHIYCSKKTFTRCRRDFSLKNLELQKTYTFLETKFISSVTNNSTSPDYIMRDVEGDYFKHDLYGHFSF